MAVYEPPLSSGGGGGGTTYDEEANEGATSEHGDLLSSGGGSYESPNTYDPPEPDPDPVVTTDGSQAGGGIDAPTYTDDSAGSDSPGGIDSPEYDDRESVGGMPDDSTTILDPSTGGTIGGGLAPTGQDSNNDGVPDAQEDQTGAISDTTHTDDGSHTTDLIPDNPINIIVDDGNPETDSGSHTVPENPINFPSVPEVPEFPDPMDPDGIGIGLLLAAAVALYIGFREVVGSGA